MGGESGVSVGKGDEKQSSSRRVQAPDYLDRLFRTGAMFGGASLSDLYGMSQQDMVPGFNPTEQAGRQAALDVAGGAGDFLPTAEQFFLGAAQGTPLASYLPEGALTALEGMSGGVDPRSYLDPDAYGALSATARGENLYGGAGFDASVQSAVESAMPHIASAFGGTRGGITGGLAKEEVGRVAIREALRQQQAERDRQQQAAGTLIGTGFRGRDEMFNAANLLTGLGGRERDRSFAAAGALPELGLFRSNIQRDIGGEGRALQERQLQDPFNRQLQMLAAALGFIPMGQLLGDDTTGRRQTREFSTGSVFPT